MQDNSDKTQPSEFIRVFWGIEITDKTQADILTCILTLQSQLSTYNIYWTPAEKLHITVRFLGNIPKLSTTALVECAKAGLHHPQTFSLSFKKLMLFPPRHHPHVIALIPEPSDPLHELAGQIDKLMAGKGCPPENRPYLPHITLGKIHSNILPDLKNIQNVPIAPQLVTQIHLIQSVSVEQVPTYVKLHTLEL